MGRPNKGFKIPWFMAAITSDVFTTHGTLNAETLNWLGNLPMILTSNTVPESITKSKPINYSEKQIPGGRTSIPQFNSFGATKISFNFKHANFNSDFGVSKQQKFFEALTYPEAYLSNKGHAIVAGVSTRQFSPPPFSKNPKVLYFYGTGSFPLFYFVTKCDLTLTHPNNLGFPQVIDVAIELVLDEDGAMFELENAYRAVSNLFATFLPFTAFGSHRKNPHYAGAVSTLKGLVKKIGIK